MNSNQRGLDRSELTKQQLFVNPITLIQKQILPSQQQQPPVQLSHPNSFTNINEIILDSVQSNIASHLKTKLITKIDTNSKMKNYRTSICPYGIECRKRLTCTYAHNQTQLRKPYKNRKSPCIRYQKGLCGLGAACPDYHGNMDLKKKNYRYKVLPCKQFNEKGHCSKGNLCIYLHGQDDTGKIIETIDEKQIDKSGQKDTKEELIQKLLEQKEEQFENQKGGCLGESVQKDKKLRIGQIFKQSIKKGIIEAKETVQQRVAEANNQQEDIGEEENFNIEFNF